MATFSGRFLSYSLPLYVKLIAEEARALHSFTDSSRLKLPADCAEGIEKLFDRSAPVSPTRGLGILLCFKTQCLGLRFFLKCSTSFMKVYSSDSSIDDVYVQILFSVIFIFVFANKSARKCPWLVSLRTDLLTNLWRWSLRTHMFTNLGDGQ